MPRALLSSRQAPTARNHPLALSASGIPKVSSRSGFGALTTDRSFQGAWLSDVRANMSTAPWTTVPGTAAGITPAPASVLACADVAIIVPLRLNFAFMPHAQVGDSPGRSEERRVG